MEHSRRQLRETHVKGHYQTDPCEKNNTEFCTHLKVKKLLGFIY